MHFCAPKVLARHTVGVLVEDSSDSSVQERDFSQHLTSEAVW